MRYIYKKESLIYFAIIYLLPITVRAASFNLATSNFKRVVEEVVSVLVIVAPLLFVLTVLMFFWGLSKFILNSGNEADVTKGKNYMIWGILGLFVLLSAGAIINLVSGDLGLGGNSGILPTIPTSVTTP